MDPVMTDELLKHPDGIKIHIDGVVIEMIDSHCPAGMTRTSWVNLLIQVGISNINLKPKEQLLSC